VRSSASAGGASWRHPDDWPDDEEVETHENAAWFFHHARIETARGNFAGAADDYQRVIDLAGSAWWRWHGHEVARYLVGLVRHVITYYSKKMGNNGEGIGARLLRELSPSQLAAVLEDSSLGRLRARFEKRLDELELPAGGFTGKEQADAAKALSNTFYQLQDLEAGFGLPLREKPSKVREGERLRAEFLRHHDEDGRPIPVRRPGRPRRDAAVENGALSDI
jgi:hypothetical protein